ncbi:hypothetical protein KH990_09045 [Methanoculleus bourgensis]|uniref:hypothetical protein n=1 Tax=Methanoculleus bourgensis TaxID=83986 RepID=UPI001BD93323|nr:hypothetical protein [Methanoculleus bourgensis]MBT0733510.1 hypothetical protein [Methanoculleus bourgensis]
MKTIEIAPPPGSQLHLFRDAPGHAARSSTITRFLVFGEQEDRARAVIIHPLAGPLPVNLAYIPEDRAHRSGRCYELALSFQMANQTWTLVHAMTVQPHGPLAGLPYPHAFVEYAGVVFDTTFAGFYPANEYYATYQVTDARKYDAVTAARVYRREKHYGPWHGAGTNHTSSKHLL